MDQGLLSTMGIWKMKQEGNQMAQNNKATSESCFLCPYCTEWFTTQKRLDEHDDHCELKSIVINW